MITYREIHKTSPTSPPAFLQLFVALAGGMLLFILFALITLVAFNISHAGEIYPGVSIAGVDLSGLSRDEAAALLAVKLTYPQTGKIVFQDTERVQVARPSDLGLILDVQTSAQAAFSLGRSGNPISRQIDKLVAWYSGRDVSPLLVYDERLAQEYLRQIAAQVDRPTVEATLKVNGGQVEAVPGQVGRKVDIYATQAALEAQVRSLTDGVVPLVVVETPPEILDASQQAETARQILSAPLTLHVPDAKPGDPGPWIIPPDQLGGMLKIERVQSPEGVRFQVGLDDKALYTYLTALAADIDRQPANARFTFNDETRLLEVIQPAVIGRNLDVYNSIQEVNQKIVQGGHDVSLKLVTTQPEITDQTTGEQLGITEQIIAYTSYFRGSTEERMQNIQTAAANFHGLLVPPGATFSMASVMGDVSLDSGYAEAWIIFGGRTIKGVGGGVCQVSTTLFRTAFLAGFPIVERYPHAYRVGYYEQTTQGYDPDMAGLDATVFVPMVDFKFVNDTPYWLLMETYFNASRRSLTWKFYSTSDGRTVEWETSGPQNIVNPPDPVYEENPELAEGEIKQVDWAAEGADVTVNRVVYRDGQVLFSDTVITHYMPWGDVYQYGPGTKLPKKKQPIITR